MSAIGLAEAGAKEYHCSLPNVGVLVWSSSLERTVRLSPCSRRVEVTVTTGTIKKVVSDRGFGFIAADDGKEYFFHRNGLTSSLDFDRLAGGEKVQFQIEQSPKGPRATNVQSA